MYMGKICKFCDSLGRIISLNVKLVPEGSYELRWCNECGRIQNS